MGNTFIDKITDNDIENIGLKVLNNGRRKNGSSHFLQCCDPDRILDDGNLICHYEILHMGEDDFTSNINHEKDKIYVEIHYEQKKYSKNFKSVLKQLSNTDNTLELFDWKNYCPGIRIKNSVFTASQKKEILQNLRLLKDKTLDVLLAAYKDVIHESSWQSDFTLASKKEQLQKNEIFQNL